MAGFVEAIGAVDVFGGLASIGFLAMIAVPTLFALSAVVRGLYVAWRPDELAKTLVEDGGGAPKLVGWLVVILLAALLLAWAAFQGTWALAAWTAFKPLTLSFLEPILAVVAVLVAIAGSRPFARMFAHLARKAVGRRTSLLRPRNVLAAAALIFVATGYVLWRFLVTRKLGPIDTSFLHAPAIAVAGLAIAHALRRAVPHERIVGAVLGVVTVVAIACAVVAVRARPSTTLEIWADQPVAGIAIERVFDLDEIRSRIPLAEFRPVDKPGAAHPDIVLVTLDTTRADHTPPYGGVADMPLLRELGKRGTIFVYSFAPSNAGKRSLPSMMTGVQANRVRGRVDRNALRLDPRHVLLAERLRAGGYETAGFVCCKELWGKDARTGLARGLEHLAIEPSGMRLAKLARAWLDTRERQPNKRPLFLWLHFVEPRNWLGILHEPLNEDDKRRMYDRALTLADGMASEVIGGFLARPADKHPIIIVTSDRGEPLGDHSAAGPGSDVYNSQVRVPFVINGPGIKSQARVAETVSLVDLTPTIVELAGFKPPNNLDGRSLADLATGTRLGNPDDGVAFIAMIKDRTSPGRASAVVHGGWKLIDNGIAYELYDIKNDPYERQNLFPQKQEIATELRRLLAERRIPRDPFSSARP